MGSLDLSGPMGMVALALPFALLIVLIFLCVRSFSRSRRQTKFGDTPSTGRYGFTLEEVPDAPAPSPPVPAPQSRFSGERLLRAIEEAERGGQEKDLAGLYLQHARELLNDARSADAAQVFTKCVRFAAKHDQRLIQAEARLELGDVARTNGDLTTACEHWQLARTLLHEMKKLSEFDTVDRKMRQNGCPTDWVLNDF